VLTVLKEIAHCAVNTAWDAGRRPTGATITLLAYLHNSHMRPSGIRSGRLGL
jgi:hypothetical protein